MISGIWKIWILIGLLAFIAGATIYGQQKDLQTWFEAELQKGLANGIDLSGEVEQRFNNNSTQYDRSQITVAASYDPWDFLSTGGGVRVLIASNREGRITPAYRFHTDATGKYSWHDVDLSLRVRFQYGFEEFLYITSFRDNIFVNRNRVKASYHLFRTRVDLFAAVETWGLFGNLNGHFLKKMRYTAGAGYRLNFQSEVSLRFIIEDEFNQINPMQSYILVFGYSYNL